MSVNERLAVWAGADDRWVIYSGEHGTFWGPNGGGYFWSIEDAGIYTEADAKRSASRCGPEKLIEIRKLPAPSYDTSIDLIRLDLLPRLKDAQISSLMGVLKRQYGWSKAPADEVAFWTILKCSPADLAAAIAEVVNA